MSKSSEFTAANEGYRQFAYQCTAGKTTIGIGFNLDDVGLSEEESRVILNMRLRKIQMKLLEDFPWFIGLNDARQAALNDMAYQLGINGLYKFKKSLALLKFMDYQAAGIEFADSRWAKQTPRRAVKVCSMIQTGEFQ